MAPTILIVGATGNTGRETVRTLSQSLDSSPFSNHRLLAVTRSANSATAQQLARMPHVQVEEYHWPNITAAWLRERSVRRAFIASHNQVSQFAEESSFLNAALRAGVEYLVRISTTAANVTPDCAASYTRAHWAIEAMLGSPEYAALHWTSLQPNVFSQFYLGPAAELIKAYRKTGSLHTLRLMAAADVPVGIIHSDDVGIIAGKLLLEKDSSKHNKAKYVLNGPEDITGAQIVAMVEKRIGAKVDDVMFKDMSFVDQIAAGTESPGVILSNKEAGTTYWNGSCTVATTSREILEFAPPKRNPVSTLEELLRE